MKHSDEYYILDRFEEQFALMETPSGEMLQIPRSELPPAAAEGDCFFFENGAWLPQPEETARRRERIRAKMEQLFHRR